MSKKSKRRRCSKCNELYDPASLDLHIQECKGTGEIKTAIVKKEKKPKEEKKVSGSSLEWEQIKSKLKQELIAEIIAELKPMLIKEIQKEIREKMDQSPRSNKNVDNQKTITDPEIFHHQLIGILRQRSDGLQVRGNFPLKDLKTIFTQEYGLNETEFEENILRLYRKQVIDLQPGGTSMEYHITSPTKQQFYYLIYNPSQLKEH